MTVTGGLVLGLRLRFHYHAPKQLAIRFAFHQQAADELGGDDLGGAGEERLRQRNPHKIVAPLATESSRQQTGAL